MDFFRNFVNYLSIYYSDTGSSHSVVDTRPYSKEVNFDNFLDKQCE